MWITVLQVVILFLAFIGVLELVVSAADLRWKSRLKGNTIAVVPLEAETEEVEMTADSYRKLLEDGGRGALLFVDRGASKEIQESCAILVREHRWIYICREEEMAESLRQLAEENMQR